MDEAVTETLTPEPAIPGIQGGDVSGVGGWLLVLCIVLSIINPIFNLIASISNLIEGDIFSAIFRLCLGGFSIYVGYCLWSIRPDAVHIAKIYLWIILILGAIIPLSLSLLLSLGGGVRSDVLERVVVSSITFAIWFTYLKLSKRVANTYVTNADVTERKKVQASVIVSELFHTAEVPAPETAEFTEALDQLSATSAMVLENARKNNYSVRSRPDTVELYRYGTLIKVCRTNGEIEAFGVQNGWKN